MRSVNENSSINSRISWRQGLGSNITTMGQVEVTMHYGCSQGWHGGRVMILLPYHGEGWIHCGREHGVRVFITVLLVEGSAVRT